MIEEEGGYGPVFAALSKEKELLFLSQKEVVDIHDLLVGKYGGSFGIRDAGALSSAVNRPLQHLAYSEDLNVDAATLGAVLWVGLAKNHAFVDGNKRVALASALRFWAKNNLTLSMDAMDLLNTSLLVARGDLLVNDVANRVKPVLSHHLVAKVAVDSLERDFHNGMLPHLGEGSITSTVRALAKDANANAFALVDAGDGKVFAVPVSDTDRSRLVIGETATFQAVAGVRHCDVVNRPDVAATLDNGLAISGKTDCEP